MNMEILLLLILFSSEAVPQHHPKDYLWKNRLIIISDPDVEKPEDSPQFMLFNDRQDENKERDVILIFITPEKTWVDLEPVSVSPGTWLEHFDLPHDYRGIALVGKDGSIKYEGSAAVIPQTIYELIDSMPMRQREMKNKN